MTDPVAGRPFIAHPEYGVPRHDRGLIEWSWVVERLASDRNYWVATVTDDGAPSARPVWGVIVDDVICFGGGPKTRWSRNLARNPRVSLHLESGTEVVIAEGSVERLTDADDPRLQAIDDAYEAKYEMRHGPPIWLLRPDVVLAWRDFPKDMTRFTFAR
ncbi:MAG: pyridoxamine 5'-phosphate oxidase family protein [Actinomycetota bacterium]|nr:pyridoxamine 5'-phosphate oxidase family protein [Actinomycetota bacterium]